MTPLEPAIYNTRYRSRITYIALMHLHRMRIKSGLDFGHGGDMSMHERAVLVTDTIFRNITLSKEQQPANIDGWDDFLLGSNLIELACRSHVEQFCGAAV